MSEWRPYLRNRLVKEHPTGFVIIVPVEAAPPVPLTCPVCSHMMRTRDDEAAYHECECCHRCAMLWAHPRRDAWKQGWRPSREQVEQSEADRMPLAVSFEVD